MKDIRKIIILIILIILIIIITLCILNLNKGKNNNVTNENSVLVEDESEEPEIEKNQFGFQQLEDRGMFFTISNCVEEYLQYLNPNYEFSKYADQSNSKKESIYSLLSENYIESNNITKDNVLEYVTTFKDEPVFLPSKVNVLYSDNKSPVYVIEGMIASNGTVEKYYFIINLCVKNSTFSIEPLDSNKIKDINEVSVNTNSILDNIESNSYNGYVEDSGEEEEIASKYLYYYKQSLLYFKEEAYNKLDKEYKEKRFENFDNFKTYIEENKEKIEQIELSKYRFTEEENKVECICVDQYGEYFIFNQTGVMDYTIRLDTYTIDAPETIEKYNKGNDKEKVGMNIEKVISALNSKDYNYAYDKLDESFRKNNFKNIQEFETYIKNNLFDINNVEYVQFSKEGETYIYQLKIKEYGSESDSSKDITVVMQLLEGTNFVMSFSMN
mgnify:CR=1 FL=1